jgi:phosphoribosylformylglycinamidine synthase PurS subunit
MARVVVNVMPKPEILDPQGQAVAGALPRLGFTGVREVRQGKRFVLDVDDSIDDETLERIAGTLLANPVIEDWSVSRLADQWGTDHALAPRSGTELPRTEPALESARGGSA